MVNLTTLQQVLGVHFKNPSLLEQALVHSSYVNENPGATPVSNERLEFLGDAVLGVIFAEKLYKLLPDTTEGEMTRHRAALVSGQALARIAAGIDLGRYLYLGKGEQASGGRRKSSNLASALEAVIAAVYLDGGLAPARQLILRLFQADLEEREDKGDFKSRLQELTQARWQSVPDYFLVEASGPDHDKRFTIEVSADGRALGQGTGRSKRQAEQAAAQAALNNLPI